MVKHSRLTSSSHWDTLTPTGMSASDYTPAETTPACPTYSASGFWTIRGNDPLPTIRDLVIPTRTLATNSSGGSVAPAAAETSAPAISTSNAKSIPPTTTPAPSSSGLSTGAKAAIGVVVPLVIIAIAAAAFLIWRRKRKAKQATDPHYDQVQGLHDDDGYARKELGGGEVSQLHGEEARNEADGRPRYQLSDGAAATPELNASNDVEPQELSSGPSIRRNPRRLS